MMSCRDRGSLQPLVDTGASSLQLSPLVNSRDRCRDTRSVQAQMK